VTKMVLRTENHGRMRTTLPVQLRLRGVITLLEHQVCSTRTHSKKQNNITLTEQRQKIYGLLSHN